MKKTMLAMSGGVDSSVAALLLQQSGAEIAGVMMHLFDPEDQASRAAAEKSEENAKRIAEQLHFSFEVVDYSKQFADRVVEDFLKVYASGATPNPCIECNHYLKFGALLDYAKAKGYEQIATGHYARIERDPLTGKYLLRKAADLTKDQSYVLYHLDQDTLARTVFPMGGFTKEEARNMAFANGFVNAHQSDSQDICFIPDGDYASFIEKRLGRAFMPGPFVSTDGKVLGTHRGIIRYTIGQRKGLGLSSESPWYVSRLDIENNAVVLSHGEELFSSEVLAEKWNLINGEPLTEPKKVKARIRYAQKEQNAWLSLENDPEKGQLMKVQFDEPQRAAAIGQSVVCYDGEYVVGGGKICKIRPQKE